MDNPLSAGARKLAKLSGVFPCHWIENGACSCGKDCGNNAGKHPLTKRGFKDASKSPQTLAKYWTKWPKANVAIATGGELFVLDIDPRHGGDESLLRLEAAIGPIPNDWSVITGSGGRHIYLRCPPNTVRCRTNLLPGLDIRGNGGYVIAPPSNHKSGGIYKWNSCVGDQPPHAPQSLLDFLSTPIAKATETEPQEYDEYDRTRAIEALSQLSPSRADDYDFWLQVGMILKEIDPSLLAVWDEWSRSSGKYQPGECERKWESFSRTGLGLGTLLLYAFEDQSADLSEFEVIANDQLQELQVEVQQPVYTLPTKQLLVRGFIRKFAIWHAKRSQHKNLRVGAVAAMATLSLLMARRMKHEDGTRANIYLLLLAASGIGKTEGVESIKHILLHLGMSNAVIERITGDAALEDEMRTWLSMIFVMEEAHNLIAAINSSRDHNLGSITTALKTFYSASKTFMVPRKRAHAKGSTDEPVRAIDQPHLTALLTAPPREFWDSLSEVSLRDGFTARVMPIEALTAGDDNEFPYDDARRFEELLRLGRAWLEVEPPSIQITQPRPSTDADGEDVSDIIDVVQPYAIRRDSDAAKLAREKRKEWNKISDDASIQGDDVVGSLWRRAYEMVCKFDLLFAGSEYDPDRFHAPEAYWISARHTQQAIDFVEATMREKHERVTSRGGDQEFIAGTDRIARFVRKYYDPKTGRPVDYNRLFRAARIKKRDFCEYVEALCRPYGSLIQVRDETNKVVGFKPREAANITVE